MKPGRDPLDRRQPVRRQPLASGRAEWAEGKAFDLRAIRSPIILFASLGDNITPPQQAINWIADLYPTTRDLKASGQVIVGLMHESVGHLGIFVSAAVARREQCPDRRPARLYRAPAARPLRMQSRRSARTVRPSIDVVLTERRVEDLQTLQKYAPQGRDPVRRRGADLAGECRGLRDVRASGLSALVPPGSGAARAGLSSAFGRDAGRLLGPESVAGPREGVAEFARAHRSPRDEAGPSVATSG